MKLTHNILPLVALTGITITLSATSAHAAVIITNGSSLTGISTTLGLNDTNLTNTGAGTSGITKSATQATITLNGTSTDYGFLWNSGLSINTSNSRYLRVDFAGFSALHGAGNMQLFTSTGSGASTLLGSLPSTPSTSAFSIFFDLQDPTNWTGTKQSFRIDPFNGTNYQINGFQMTITGAQFGSGIVTVPEPSIAALGCLGLVGLLIRRRF